VTVRLQERPRLRNGVRSRGRRPRPPLTTAAGVAHTVVGVLCLLLLAFVVEVGVVGQVREVRAQRLGYADLRYHLARGDAPLGQTDVNGVLVPLGTPVALLQIPSIGLSQVVFEGTTSSVLTRGPGHRRDTPYPGQPGTSLIYGRQSAYGGPFARVPDLKRGDTISVATAQGVQSYTVTDLRTAGDPIPVLNAGESRLTLITADGIPFVPSRIVRVDAQLKTKVQLAPAVAFGTGSLPTSEGVMVGDRSAALPLFLWAELLLLAALALVWVRSVWGRWQTWVVAVPVLALTCLEVAHQAAMLLPNLI
jgi:sortase A